MRVRCVSGGKNTQLSFYFLHLALIALLQACSYEDATTPEAATEAAPAAATAATVVDDAALADETDGRNWLAYGRTYSEKRYSPLKQINDGNVSEIGVDWYLDLPRA